MDWFLPQLWPRPKARVVYAGRFVDVRMALPQGAVRTIDGIVDALKKKPDRPADQEFMKTEAGVMRTSRDSGFYVLYQLFTNDPPPPFRLKFWYCGRYELSDGRAVYDFE